MVYDSFVASMLEVVLLQQSMKWRPVKSGDTQFVATCKKTQKSQCEKARTGGGAAYSRADTWLSTPPETDPNPALSIKPSPSLQ